MISLFRVIVAIGAILLVWAASALADVRIGVLALRGPEAAKTQWQGLAEHLSKKLDDTVVIIPLAFDEVLDFCNYNEGELLVANPWLYVQARESFGARALVTMRRRETGSVFGGVIIVRKDSGIHNLKDLIGKRVVCPTQRSAGGWLFQKALLVTGLIDPKKDLASILTVRSHDKVVTAVIEGNADVGFVRTSIPESMQKEGIIELDDLSIIHPVSYNTFPHAISTPLYPEWPVASLSGTPHELSRRARRFLMQIPADHTALKGSGITGFVEPMDYGPVEEAMRFLGEAPFNGTTE